MKVSQEIECGMLVKAQLAEDGRCEVSVSATAVYDALSGASTTVRLAPTDESVAQVKAVLEAALASCHGQLATKLTEAIVTSRSVGRRMGEIA